VIARSAIDNITTEMPVMRFEHARLDTACSKMT
jgi:hypothetical protein